MPLLAADVPQPAADALKVVDEAAAEFTNRLHTLLAAFPELVLRRGAHAREVTIGEGAPVFADPSGLYWQPLGELAGSAPDLDAHMALLARYEPSLAALERALGISFAPEAIAAQCHPATRWIELVEGGRAFAFGFAPPLQEAERLAGGAAQVRLAAVPIGVTLGFRAALLPLGEVEALAAGDLLCLPAGPMRAELVAGSPDRAIECTWNQGDGLLALGFAPAGSERTRMNDSDDDQGAARFKVPLTVRLPEIAVPAAEIEALAEGGTIRLAPLAEGLEVDLLVAGQPVASGEIVRLGEDFAVLIDRVVRRSPAASVATLGSGAE